METAIVLVIVLLILVVAAVVLMNMNTNKNTEAITEAQEKINKLKNSIAETKLKTSRSKPDKVKQVKIDEEPEDDIVYLKSAAAVDVQSPDIEKNNFPIESDEVRASAMESQNIVENDVKKKVKESTAKIAPRVINKGPDSMKISPIFTEKLQSAARKVKEQERNEEIKRGIDRARHTGPMPSPELIRMGPPKMVDEIDTFGPRAERKVPEIGNIFEQMRERERRQPRPAVCRELPGSPFDSCGRPSSVGPVRTAIRVID